MSRPEPTPVIVLGAHLSALGTLRVLSRRGIPCFVAEDTTNIVTASRWYRPTERTLPETADPEVLAAFLRSLSMPRAVLIACSDSWALAVAGLPEDVRERFPSSIAPYASIQAFVDKDRFRALGDELDLPRPRSLVIEGPADLDHATDDEVSHGFLKPTESQRNNRTFGGAKGFFIRSRKEALERIEQGSAAGITFLLQDWIPGGPQHTHLVDGVVDRGGRVVALMARRRVRMDPPRLANSSLAVTVPLANVEEIIEPIRRMLAATAYRGIFNIEVKLDPRDGRIKIIELNPRPFWFIGQVAKAGVDLAWMSYLDAVGAPVVTPPSYELGRYQMHELLDAKAILRAWSSGRRPSGPVVRPWLLADRAMLWWSDPLPAVSGVRGALSRRLRGRHGPTTGA